MDIDVFRGAGRENKRRIIPSSARARAIISNGVKILPSAPQ